jgi:oligopeptidase A
MLSLEKGRAVANPLFGTIPAELAQNPLLAKAGTPQFHRIKAAHIVPAVRFMLVRAEEALHRIEAGITPTWAGAVEAFEPLNRMLERAWGPVTHLFGVMNTDALRQAYETVRPEVVRFGLRVSQSEAAYKALKALKGGSEWKALDAGQQRIVDRKLLSCEQSGIGLAGAERQRFNDIEQELSQAGTQFSNHVLDANKAWSLLIENPADTEGWPETLRRIMAAASNRSKPEAAAEATPEAGPWRVTLELPIFGPFMQHCRNRRLREEVYRAYMTRASAGELDNTALCVKVLTLRKEKAKLLGYATFADLSLAQKMAPSVAAVEAMFETLLTASLPAARKDLDEVATLARQHGQSEPIEHWDLAFWAERLREARYDFKDEELRPYFAHETVLDGLFDLLRSLFGITIARKEAPVWHPDVRFYEVTGERGTPIAGFFYDPYSRPETKRPGAWMDDCLGRRPKPDGVQLPVAYLVCNATPPMGDTPSLMGFREIQTLFHEFGHGLQHMLTTVDYPDAAGINGIEWDAVELPSQFMENWCYHRPTIDKLARHYQTGARLPDDLTGSSSRRRPTAPARTCCANWRSA